MKPTLWVVLKYCQRRGKIWGPTVTQVQGDNPVMPLWQLGFGCFLLAFPLLLGLDSNLLCLFNSPALGSRKSPACSAGNGPLHWLVRCHCSPALHFSCLVLFLSLVSLNCSSLRHEYCRLYWGKQFRATSPEWVHTSFWLVGRQRVPGRDFCEAHSPGHRCQRWPAAGATHAQESDH